MRDSPIATSADSLIRRRAALNSRAASGAPVSLAT
jgi:hypothetical protein